MHREVALIEGSARNNGDTRKFTDYLRLHQPHWSLFDLTQINIGHYDYLHANKHDDFLQSIDKILDHRIQIWITPVYWYSVSGRMKVFMDRISDLLDEPYKDLGRKFRGKYLASISCSRDPNPITSFEIPLKATAGYLGMNYLGHHHVWIEKGEVSEPSIQSLDQLMKKISTMK